MAKKKINCEIIEFDIIDKNDIKNSKPKCFGNYENVCSTVICGENYNECKIVTEKNVNKK